MSSRTPSSFTIESLESRRLLAATVALDRGILTVVGDAAADRIDVAYSADRSELLVTVNGTSAGGYSAASVGRVSIDGGAGDDVITTDFRGRSILRGGPGNDSINAGGGDDQLFGDAGNDTILGNRGRDVIYGGDGNDVLSGGTGPDVLIGEAGNDSVVGSAGDDRLFGDGILDTDSENAAAGSDTLGGSEGRDTLYGGLGADLISGGPGTQDLVNYSDRSADLFVTIGAADQSGARGERDTVTVDTEKVNGGAGNDVLQGSGGRNVLFGGPGNDVLLGEGGADSLFGAEGNDSLAGGSGSDLLDGGTGTNDLEGGDGNDTLNLQAGAADTYDAGGGANTVNAGPNAVNRALAQPQSYTNPTQDADWPDPTIVRVGDTFYMSHTTGGPDFGNPLYSSKDLTNWTFVKNLLTPENKPAFMRSEFWAPEIHRVNGKFVLVTTSTSSVTNRLTIAIAQSDAIDGTYTYQDQPIVSDGVSVLDPSIFQDDDGRVYLLWKRDADRGGGVGGSIRIREMNAAGTAFADGSAERVLLASDVGQGQPFERGLVEAPEMIKRGGQYYLFYSGGFIDDSYRVGVARGGNLTDPFERNPANPIVANNATWNGPGHGQPFADADGTEYFYYHAHHGDPNAVGGRVQVMDRIEFVDGWPTFGNGGTVSTAPQTAPRTGDFPAYAYALPPAGPLSGTSTLTGGATDDRGVAKYDFFADSASGEAFIGHATRDGDRWVLDWNTRAAANGTYALTARVTDTAGHVTTAPSRVVAVAN